MAFQPSHLNVLLLVGSPEEDPRLEAVYIYFGTETYDEYERDVKVTFDNKFCLNTQIQIKVTTEAQLGLIGGTMGLLTGFSILSGVEIIYYLIRFGFSI